ncbi:MAG: hypothetical protein PHZ00_03325 [Candidatus Peribacteraceae bacterium]|nr:hypothetical protein [Candidatus Peribacteraceae bacterium]
MAANVPDDEYFERHPDEITPSGLNNLHWSVAYALTNVDRPDLDPEFRAVIEVIEELRIDAKELLAALSERTKRTAAIMSVQASAVFTLGLSEAEMYERYPELAPSEEKVNSLSEEVDPQLIRIYLLLRTRGWSHSAITY